MVEVVQDLLDHVTYAGGVGRRRVDAVRGIASGTPCPGASDCAVVAEDPVKPCGPRILRMQELMFHEMLDKPFEEKQYRLQLEEFAYRGERIIKQVDQKFGQVQRMISHDVLARSRMLPSRLQSTNDELRNAHKLICGELESVWGVRFEPFFYPSEAERPSADAMSPDSAHAPPPVSTTSATPGGWLDLDDMFLTARLLTRFMEELMDLINAVVRNLPEGAMDCLTGRVDAASSELRAIVTAFSARVPWVGISMPPVPDAAGRRALHSQPSSSNIRAGSLSPLNEAIMSLDRVLTVHMKNLVCDLHRTTYQTFVRICAAYARWKRAFQVERERAKEMERVEKAQRRGTLPTDSSLPRLSTITPPSPRTLQVTSAEPNKNTRRDMKRESAAQIAASFVVQNPAPRARKPSVSDKPGRPRLSRAGSRVGFQEMD